jgi:hypothetical protein
MSGLQAAHATVVGDALKAGFQNFVDQSAVLTAVNGTPGAGQFRSSITGRAPIPDITNDLRPSLGVERVMTQQIVELQNEFGPSGEPVFAALNDERGLIRLIGSWVYSVSANGETLSSGTLADFIEVTFYGTGLNMLIRAHGGIPITSMG